MTVLSLGGLVLHTTMRRPALAGQSKGGVVTATQLTASSGVNKVLSNVRRNAYIIHLIWRPLSVIYNV